MRWVVLDRLQVVDHFATEAEAEQAADDYEDEWYFSRRCEDD